MLISVGTIGTPCSTKRGQVPGKQPGPVFDAVDAGVEHVIEGCPPREAMRAVTRAPSSWAARTASLTTGQGSSQRGRRRPRSIQSPTSLTQPSPARACLRDRLHEALGFHFDSEAAQVAARPRDVPARADEARQLPSLLQPAGVVHRAGVADQQGTRVTVGQRLLLRNVLRDIAAGTQTDVAVASTRPG